MCRIASNELVGTGIDARTVNLFSAWFVLTFGHRNVSAADVLAAYINHKDASRDAIDHLVSLQQNRCVVFDTAMNGQRTLRMDAVLFIPSGTTVECDVQAGGVHCAGDIVFKGGVTAQRGDIRVYGRVVAKHVSCFRASCITGDLFTTGDMYCEGDLLVERQLICHGALRAVGHLRASFISVGSKAVMDTGLEVSDGLVVGDSFRHAGRLEVSNQFAVA